MKSRYKTLLTRELVQIFLCGSLIWRLSGQSSPFHIGKEPLTAPVFLLQANRFVKRFCLEG